MAKRNKGTGKATLPPRTRTPDAGENAAIERAIDAYLQRREPVKAALAGNSIVAPHSEKLGWLAQLASAAGTRSIEFAEMLVDQLARQGRWNGQSTTDVKRLNAFLALLDAFEPASEVEALLLAQLAATHDLAMEMAWRAKQADWVQQTEVLGNLAVKLMRTYALQAEALAKLRRGGEQRVKVEHVHVYPGGQAIVGDVHTGGGALPKSEEQPHAITDGGRDLLRCQDAKREAMPIPADDERPLQDARRPLPRRT